jgi:hypothetical protein
MYNPTTGRWLSRDPIGFEAKDANLYRYVLNSPVNKVDPSGKEVSLFCRPVRSSRTRGAGGVYLGDHCAVVANCNGQWVRYDGGGLDDIDEKTGRPVPDRRPTKATGTFAPSFDKLFRGDPGKKYDVISPWCKCENELKCLENAYNRIQQLRYSVTGANSNTYAHALLRVCSLAVKPYVTTYLDIPPGTRDTFPRVRKEITVDVPRNAFGWNAGGYGDTVKGSPPPDWKK